jgi:hypothetical protein
MRAVKQDLLKLEPSKWLTGSGLGAARHASRGIWIMALCRMHFAPEPGRLRMPESALRRCLGVDDDQEWRAFLEDVACHEFGYIEVQRSKVGKVIVLEDRMILSEQKVREQTAVRAKRFRDRRKVAV